jgi:multiple sugar transport system permease protein
VSSATRPAPRAAAPPWWQNRRIVGALERALTYGAILFLLTIVLFPLAWMLSASLKANADIFTYPPKWLPPWPPLWSNYPQGLETMQFGKGLRNTLLIALPCVLGQTLSCALVGYGLARVRFPGRDALFVLVLATMMLPGQVTLIPAFVLYSKLGLVDTFWPFWLPAWTATSGFNIFLLRQFFLTISPELEDAARIDGAGAWSIYWRIMLPLVTPAVTAVALFAFVHYWNDFFGPLIYLPSDNNRTLQLLLMRFQQFYRVDWGPMMAAQVVIVLPPLLVFLVAQRKFIQGIVFTGIKG